MNEFKYPTIAPTSQPSSGNKENKQLTHLVEDFDNHFLNAGKIAKYQLL